MIIAQLPSSLWWASVILMALLLVGQFSRKHARRREKLLSWMAEEELRSAYQEPLTLRERVRRLLGSLYCPSRRSLATLLGVAGVVLVLNALPWLKQPVSLPFFDPLRVATPFAVMVGLSTVVFALALFVAESLQGPYGPERGRVLLRESGLFPLTVLVVLLFIALGISNSNSWIAGLTVLCVGGLIIRAFSAVIRLLLDAPRLERGRRDLLVDRMRNGARALLRKRVMDVLFQNETNKARHFRYSPSPRWVDPDGRGATREIFANAEGFVSDINIGALEYFDKWLSGLRGSATGRQADDRLTQAAERSTTALAYVFLRVGEAVSRTGRRGPRAIGAICDDGSLDETTFAAAERILRSAYIIATPTAESDYLDDLTQLQNQAQDAIRKHDPQMLQQVSSLYIDCVSALLDVFQRHGLSHTAVQAKQEIHSLEGGWEPIKRLVRSIGHLVTLAAKEADQHVLIEVAGLPARLVHLSWEYRDQYVLQTFLRFQPQLLRLGLECPATQVGRHLVDRSWRFLNETVDFFLIPVFNDSSDSGEWGRAREAIDACLSTYQELLKVAVDAAAEDAVDTLANRLQRLRLGDSGRSIRHKAFLRRNTPAVGSAAEVSAADARQQHIDHLIQSRAEITFGAAMWALYRWEHRDAGFAEKPTRALGILKKLMDSLPLSTKDLTTQYLRVSSFEKEEAWGWDNWEMEEHADGDVHFVGVQDRIERLYILAMLQRIGREELPEGAVLPFTRDFALRLAQPGSSADKFLNELNDANEQWGDLIGQEEVSRILRLRQLFRKTVEAYRDEEACEIAARQIDDSKVTQFIDEVARERARVGVIRRLMSDRDRVQYQEVVIEERTACLALSTVVPKEAFFEEWYAHFVRFGEGFGRSVAQGEDMALYQVLAKSSQEQRRIRGRAADVLRDLEEWLKAQRKGRDEDCWIILASRGFAFDAELWSRADYVSPWQLTHEREDVQRVPGLEGVLKLEGRDIWLYEVAFSDGVSAIMLNSRTLPVVTVYRPIAGASFAGAQIIDGMLIRITDLNANDSIRKRILDENPRWLAKEGEPETHLRKRALIEIRTKCEAEPGMGIRGVYIEAEAGSTE